MAVLPIYIYGSPILHKKLLPIDDLPQDFDRILSDMWETMYDDEGIGLSANQVGLDLRFFVADFSLRQENLGREVIINPVIIKTEGEVIGEEGCLSLPNIREQIPRAEKIILRYENRERKVIEREFNDLVARVIQHETDHLDGLTMVDRISSLKRSFLRSKLKRLATAAAEGKFAKDIE
ncbi:MAG TPA: peptide deformylase [Candidatus Marinimicrobia bacterium]|nr:peptide deformylase [Candidatus Neomarinimicrobiota bacterium]